MFDQASIHNFFPDDCNLSVHFYTLFNAVALGLESILTADTDAKLSEQTLRPTTIKLRIIYFKNTCNLEF